MKSVFMIAVLSCLGYIGLACFNYVHAWPLLFPCMGGIIAMAVNKSHPVPHSYGYVLRQGLYGALLACILTIPAYWLLAKDIIGKKNTETGYMVNNGLLSQNTILAILSVGAIFFITYLFGTVAGFFFPSKKVNAYS